MAFGFGKNPFEKLMSMYGSLSDEEKLKFKEAMNSENIDTQEDMEEIKTDDTIQEDTKADEVSEETAEMEATEEVAPDTECEECDAEVEAIDEDDIAEKGEEENLSNESTEVETPTEENPTEPTVDYSAMQDVLAGMNAKYDALESKFNELLAQLTDKGTTASEDLGISGYGKSSVESAEQDDRLEKIRKSVGYRNY